MLKFFVYKNMLKLQHVPLINKNKKKGRNIYKINSKQIKQIASKNIKLGNNSKQNSISNNGIKNITLIRVSDYDRDTPHYNTIQ